MAMTEEQRRQARNEASRRWRLAHKAAGAKNAVRKPKTAEVKKTKASAKKPAKDPSAGIQKTIETIAAKNAKAYDALCKAVKSLGPAVSDLFKTGDQKLIKKMRRCLCKNLGIDIVTCDEAGTAHITVIVPVKTVRIPKTRTEQPGGEKPEDITATAPAIEPPDTPSDDDDDDDDDDFTGSSSREVSVDPALLSGIEDGSVSEDDIDSQSDDNDEDEYDEDRDGDEDDDDLTDEERRERDEQGLDDDYAEGRAEMMREISEQGGYDA